MSKKGKLGLGVISFISIIIGAALFPTVYLVIGLLFVPVAIGYACAKWLTKGKLAIKHTSILLLLSFFFLLLGGVFSESPQSSSPNEANQLTKTAKKTTNESTVVSTSKTRNSDAAVAREKAAAAAQAKKVAEEAKKAELAAQAKKAAKAKTEAEKLALATQESASLAQKEYEGTQTIDVNSGVPVFTTAELSTTNGAWETYGNLDALNRVTAANALLNQSLMPTGERGDISSVTPTGWKNKKIKKGYLYNRSHLIGFALSGENANPQNLMTGTQQLNNPEMLRFEMDIKTYLEADAQRFVRYRVTPVFRDNELVARGVHLEAQSINDGNIRINVYIFNIEEGVTIRYSDGSSVVSSAAAEPSSSSSVPTETTSSSQTAAVSANAANGEQQYVDASGNGLIKGSSSGIYHIPGSTYYQQTTNPVAWFKTVSEAVNAGYRAPKR